MGRPAKAIDGDTVRKLARLGCTQEEIADFFDCSHSVISERFRQEFHVGRGESKISLRRLQWKAARGGSVPMLIHLGKVYLGQTDRLDVTSKGGRTMVYIERANNPRDPEFDDLIAAYRGHVADKANNPRDAELNGFGDNDTVIVLPAKEGEKVQ